MVAGAANLGYPDAIVRTLGAVLLVCVTLYAIPRASILGALLLTGYLGGAVASHARIGSPLMTHVLFPMFVGVFVWGDSCCETHVFGISWRPTGRRTTMRRATRFMVIVKATTESQADRREAQRQLLTGDERRAD